MSLLRMILCLATVAALALTQGTAAAKAAHEPVTAMVICGESGPRTVQLDMQGNETQNECCDCPDCLGGVTVIVLSLDSPSHRFATADSRLASFAPAPIPSQHHRYANPRGPPVKVVAGIVTFIAAAL